MRRTEDARMQQCGHKSGHLSFPNQSKKETTMSTHRLFALVMVVAVCVLSACAAQVQPPALPAAAPTALPAPDKPITLRLAVADAQDRPSQPYVLAFIDQVKARSHGSITVEPVWQAGDDTF